LRAGSLLQVEEAAGELEFDPDGGREVGITPRLSAETGRPIPAAQDSGLG
jgi:hypothetical protein